MPSVGRADDLPCTDPVTPCKIDLPPVRLFSAVGVDAHPYLSFQVSTTLNWCIAVVRVIALETRVGAELRPYDWLTRPLLCAEFPSAVCVCV